MNNIGAVNSEWKKRYNGSCAIGLREYFALQNLEGGPNEQEENEIHTPRSPRYFPQMPRLSWLRQAPEGRRAMGAGDEAMKTRDEQIQEIIANFDWEKVHKVMVALDWQWAKTLEHEEGIPKIGDLVNTATALLTDVYKQNAQSVSCGGFSAVQEDGLLGLEFRVDYYFVEE